MKRDHTELFSSDRFSLFTGMAQNIEPNIHFKKDSKIHELQVTTPTTQNEQKQLFSLIIERKNAQIRQLKRKLRLYQTNLNETRHKLESTNYELQFFKKKVYQEIQKSKQSESQIELTNKKLVQMINSLQCVKKLKNPIELRQDIDWQEASKRVQKFDGNAKTPQRINIYCLENLERIVIKVVSIIESAFKLKKVKSQKNFVPFLDKPEKIKNLLNQKSMVI